MPQLPRIVAALSPFSDVCNNARLFVCAACAGAFVEHQQAMHRPHARPVQRRGTTALGQDSRATAPVQPSTAHHVKGSLCPTTALCIAAALLSLLATISATAMLAHAAANNTEGGALVGMQAHPERGIATHPLSVLPWMVGPPKGPIVDRDLEGSLRRRPGGTYFREFAPEHWAGVGSGAHDVELALIPEHLAVAVLARDVAAALPGFLPSLRATCAAFANCTVAVLENGSLDGSGDMLRAWARSPGSPRVVFVPAPPATEAGSGGAPSAADLPSTPGHPGTAAMAHRLSRRTAVLGRLRDALLAAVLSPSFGPWDTLAVVDSDMLRGWDPHRWLYALWPDVAPALPRHALWPGAEHHRPWDAVCANGVLPGGRGRHYDWFAFRSEALNLSRGVASWPGGVQHFLSQQGHIGQAIRSVSAFAPGGPWLPVQSCFGGMAFYRRAVLDTSPRCSYSPASPAAGVGECEHVLFHTCLDRRSGGGLRLFLVPSFVVWNTASEDLRDEWGLPLLSLWANLLSWVTSG